HASVKLQEARIQEKCRVYTSNSVLTCLHRRPVRAMRPPQNLHRVGNKLAARRRKVHLLSVLLLLRWQHRILLQIHEIRNLSSGPATNGAPWSHTTSSASLVLYCYSCRCYYFHR